MRKELFTAVLLTNSAALLLGNAIAAQESRMIELSAPRAVQSSEAVELQVTTAPLPLGARVVIRTERGELLGAVTSSEIPGAIGGATGTVPVPRGSLVDGRLRVEVQVLTQGQPPRAPRENEIKLMLVIAPTK